jgi:hypothetical protein
MQFTTFKKQGAGCKVRSFFYILCLSLFLTSYSYSQNYQDDIQSAATSKSEEYHESALRRAEIIFTISIPFTAIHSYLTVRGVEMIRQGKVSPKMMNNDWSLVGGLTIAFSSFVVFWDWLHTHDKIVSDRNLPGKKTEPLTSKNSEIYSTGDSIFVSMSINF